MNKRTFGYGEYHYFRRHSGDGGLKSGWGVRRTSDSEIVALTFDKNMAAIMADMLNAIGPLYDLHEALKDISIAHKIMCGAIYEMEDIQLTIEDRIKKYEEKIHESKDLV